MATPTNTKRPVPQDIAEAYNTTKWLSLDLDDLTSEEFAEWRGEVRATNKRYQAGEEVDWDGLREWGNEICDDGAYPHLFN